MKINVIQSKIGFFGLVSFALVMTVQAQWLRTAPNVYLQTGTDNVGIGTNAANPGDANSRLNVAGNLSLYGAKWSAIGDEAKINFGWGGHYIKGLYGTGVQISACGLVTPAITIRDKCTGSAYDGNVGIGTVTPTAQLEVANSFKANGKVTLSGLVNINGGTGLWDEGGFSGGNLLGIGLNDFIPGLIMQAPTGIIHQSGKENLGISFSRGMCPSYQSGKYWNWVGQGIEYYQSTTTKNNTAFTLGLLDRPTGSINGNGTQPGGYFGPTLVYCTIRQVFSIDANGTVGITPTLYACGRALNVAGDAKIQGTVACKEIVVTQNPVFPYPDYVFEKNYKLTSLDEVDRFIRKEKHLPGVPTAVHVEQKGMNVGEMQVILLKKVEEITLHMIELKNENDNLRTQITELKSEMKTQGK